MSGREGTRYEMEWEREREREWVGGIDRKNNETKGEAKEERESERHTQKTPTELTHH